jgi:putative FmdB family regulatory protein
MPLYDFHCAVCDKTSELLVRFDDKPSCPHCGSGAMVRAVSGTSPPGISKGLIKAGRARAAREGHLSNFGH